MKLSSSAQRLLEAHCKWRQLAQGAQIGAFRIATTSAGRTSRAGSHRLVIIPSFMYGSGGNALTRLALLLIPELLSGCNKRRDRVLDLGCGSGILAIACAKLGFQRVDALDVSRAAVRSTRQHAALNSVVVTATSSLNTKKRYKLVLANLPGAAMFEYAHRFAAMLEPGGIVYASGFDREQEPSLVPLFYQHGLAIRDVKHGGGWNALILRRP